MVIFHFAKLGVFLGSGVLTSNLITDTVCAEMLVLGYGPGENTAFFGYA
jgi:hypothetical protein